MEQDWLERFHGGSREVLARVYEEQFDAVRSAVGRVLRGADQETVVHQVFYRLVAEPRTRTGFRGGDLGAYLRRIAVNQAVDYARKHGRECSCSPQEALRLAESQPGGESSLDPEQLLLVARFRSEHLPPAWVAVFDARFLGGLSQREAAVRLGLRRTTLAYQELCIRARLKKYLFAEEEL